MEARGGIFVVLSAFLALTASLDVELRIAPTGDVQTKPLGSNIVLTCSVTGLSPEVDAHLRWFDKNDEEIQLTSGRVYIEPNGPQIMKLYITSIENGDAGLYTCKGDIEGQPEQSVTLEIFKDITFDHAPSPQHPKNGTDWTIECRVSGQPVPTVSWKYRGDIITSGGRYEVLPDEGLRIFGVNKEQDDGQYTCRAEVAGDGRMQQELITVDVHIAPKMAELVGEQTGIAGQQTSLSCHATGLPPPKYEFYKNNEQNAVQPSERVIIDADGGAIHFDPLIKGDEGKYRCLATNDVGSDEDTGDLFVQVPPKIHTLINQTAQEGQSQTLTCLAEGDPAPDMTFHKVGNPDPYIIGDNENGDIVLKNDEDGKLEMTVKNLNPEDTANYTCIATNEAGDNKLNGTLIVHYAPTFDPTHQTDFYLWGGKTRNITCFPQCEPKPDDRNGIRWFKDGHELINNETFKIYKMEKNTNLQITCREEDQGWIYGIYTCDITNTVGNGKKELNVLRARLPGAPQGVTVREQSPTLLILDVIPPTDTGGIPIYGYRVQYEQSIQDFGLGEPVRIENLKPATGYLFQISAKNEVGVGNALTYSHNTEEIRQPYPVEPTSSPISLYAYEYDLKWEVPKTGGMSIEEYEFKIRKVKKSDNGEIVEPLNDWIRYERNDDPEAPMISYRFKMLSPSTDYQVEIRARNSIGWSDPNLVFTFQTLEGPIIDGSTENIQEHTEVKTTTVSTDDKGDEPGASLKQGGIGTAGVIGIVIVVFLVFLIIVDVSCYFMNGCGVLMCICVNLCGKPQPINKEKAMEEGESKEALKQPVEEAIVAQEQDVVEEEPPEKEELPDDPPQSPPPAEEPQEDEKKAPSGEEKMEELEPEDKDKPDEVIEDQVKEVPPEEIKDGGQEDEVEADEKTPLKDDPKC